MLGSHWLDSGPRPRPPSLHDGDRDDSSSVYSQDSPTLGSASASRTVVCPGPFSDPFSGPDPASQLGAYYEYTPRGASMPPPRPPRDAIDPTLAAFNFPVHHFPGHYQHQYHPYQHPPIPSDFDAILARHDLGRRRQSHASLRADHDDDDDDRDQDPDRPRRTFFSRESLSFARKVLQTGRRKQPPVRVDTLARPAYQAPADHPERTAPFPGHTPETAIATTPRPSTSRSAHRTSAGSAVAKVFRRSSRQTLTVNRDDPPPMPMPMPESGAGAGAVGTPTTAALAPPPPPPPTPANHANRISDGSGGSGWYSDDSDESDDVVEQQRIIPTWSRRASGPDTPRPPLSSRPEHPWHGIVTSRVKAVVRSREEKRRAALRDKIRVIPETGHAG